MWKLDASLGVCKAGSIQVSNIIHPLRQKNLGFCPLKWFRKPLLRSKMWWVCFFFFTPDKNDGDTLQSCEMCWSVLISFCFEDITNCEKSRPETSNWYWGKRVSVPRQPLWSSVFAFEKHLQRLLLLLCAWETFLIDAVVSLLCNLLSSLLVISGKFHPF